MNRKMLGARKGSLLSNPFCVSIFVILLQAATAAVTQAPNQDYRPFGSNNTLEIVLEPIEEPKKGCDKLATLIESSNTNLQRGLAVFQNIIEKKEQDEVNRLLPEDIIRFIESDQFSEAEEKFKQAKNGPYLFKYIVRKVYNNRVGNFDLLHRFANFTKDVESKFKIYDALYNEMKDNNQICISKLIRLRKSIENEILRPEGGIKAAESLRDILRKVVEEKSINPIIANVINNESPIIPDFGGCFQCLVDIYQQAIEKLWDKLSTEEIFDRMRSKLNNLDAKTAFDVAMLNELYNKNQLNTNKTLKLAHLMKSTTTDPNYNFLPSEIRCQHEVIKSRLPVSVRSIVFSNEVCVKNVANNEYLYIANDTIDSQRRRALTRPNTDFPLGSTYRWIVKFVNENRIKLFNSFYDELLFGEYGDQPTGTGPYDGERRYVFTWIPGSHNHQNDDPNGTWDQWNIEPTEDGMYVENQYEKQYLDVDSATKYVLTYRSGIKPSKAKWEFTECSIKGPESFTC